MLCAPHNESEPAGSPDSLGSQPITDHPSPHNSLVDIIQENAAGPKRAKGDSGEMEQHSLKDQIEADRYLASKRAAARKGLGARISKLVPPGAA